MVLSKWKLYLLIKETMLQITLSLETKHENCLSFLSNPVNVRAVLNIRLIKLTCVISVLICGDWSRPLKTMAHGQFLVRVARLASSVFTQTFFFRGRGLHQTLASTTSKGTIKRRGAGRKEGKNSRKAGEAFSDRTEWEQEPT